MEDIIVMLVIAVIITAAITKIVIEKRKGVKCIGCPLSGTNKVKCGCKSSK